MFEKIKKYWERITLIIVITGALGFNGTVVRDLVYQLQKSQTFTETSHSALRSLMDLKAIGIVKIDGKHLEVEIRRCGMIVDGKLKEAEWAFVVNGHTEMYEAVYSPVQRGYHYVDFKGDFIFVKYLTYDEDYLRLFVDNLPE